MSNESGLNEFRYGSSNRNWYELPVDLSASDFCDMVNNSGKLQKKLTREQIQRAVNHIHYDKENEKKDKRDEVGVDAKNFIYRDIYLWHLENKSNKDNINLELDPSEQKYTNPSHFYWETRDLLTALAVAFSKDTGLKNEALAQQTLKELGKLLGEKSPDDVESDIITQKMLLGRYIQENMAMSFEKDLETRLRAIWDLSHQIPSSAMGKAMMDTLRKLDIILLELVDLRDQKSEQGASPQPPEEFSDKQLTAYEKFEQLYREALKPRNAMRQRDPESNVDISFEEQLRFVLPAGEENKIIIKKIQELLETYNRNNKRKVNAEFEDLYRLYLMSQENRPELAEAALSFLEDYQKLEQYAHGESSAAEFSVRFRQELYSFARDIFASTDRSYMDFRYILDHTFLCANDAFAYGRLDAVHQAIWKEIDVPIWLIRIQKVFLIILRTEMPYYENLSQELMRTARMEFLNVAIQPQLQLLHGAIREARRLLHENYPSLDLLFSDEPKIIDRFIRKYNEVSHAIYHQREIVRSEVEEYLSSTKKNPQNVIANNGNVVYAETILMEMECKILVSALIDEAVDAITVEHNKLNPLFKLDNPVLTNSEQE